METVIRETGSARRAEEWSLVLAAAGIGHRLDAVDGGWAVVVADSEATRAGAALDAYDDEDHADEPAAPAEPAAAPWGTGMVVAAGLAGFFAVTGRPVAGSPWFERGAAAAGLLLEREPWRAVTALTLHVDGLHVAGNAVAIVALLPALVQRLGAGLALALVLLAGVAGNVLAALVHAPEHVAVGASTAGFGAIGLLAVLRLFPAAAPEGRPRRPWTVLVTAVLLLAMLGAGRASSDVLAHGFGLLGGAVLGLAGAPIRRPPGTLLQGLLLAGVALTVVGCWRLALGGGD